MSLEQQGWIIEHRDLIDGEVRDADGRVIAHVGDVTCTTATKAGKSCRVMTLGHGEKPRREAHLKLELLTTTV